MLTAEKLDEAVRLGIITADQMQSLLAMPETMNEEAADIAAGRDEAMRLIGGGNDVFVTIGVVLLSAGLFFAVDAFAGERPFLQYAINGIFFWLVAEVVTRQHRMRLASTVLGLGFIWCVAQLVLRYVNEAYGLSAVAGASNPLVLLSLRAQAAPVALITGGVIIAAAALYFWRFRVPIMAAVIALTGTFLAFVFTALLLYDGVTAGTVPLPATEQIPDVISKALYMPLLCGLVVFAVAVLLDLKDRARVTVWSDCAFWLHVVSAPLLVHPLFILATGQDVAFGRIEPGTSATVMLGVLIAAFVFVALAIDRRSLLIPTLAYFGTLGIYYLVNSAANSTGVPPFALILLVVGALIIAFGAGWQRIRRLIVAPMLPTSVLDRLPPIKA